MAHDRACVSAAGLQLDFSRHPGKTLSDARATLQGLAQHPGELISGNLLNSSECGAAWHLLARQGAEGADAPSRAAVDFLRTESERATAWVRSIEQAGEMPLDIIHLGIGGCDVPLRAAYGALAATLEPRCRIHWVANLDGATLRQALAACDPANTWVLVNSKSFGTQEVLRSAQSVLRWLEGHWGAERAASRLVALTAYPGRVRDSLLIPDGRIFSSLPEIGGRFSLWSVHGLVLTLAFGETAVGRLHAGALEMDRHLLQTPVAQSAPALLAGLSYVTRSQSQQDLLSIALYGDAFAHTCHYLQQLLMESLGKSIAADGCTPLRHSGPVVLAGVGTSAQHSYFQYLHQSGRPALHEFIAVRHAWHDYPEHHRGLLANALAQAEALWRGRSAAEWDLHLLKQGLSVDEAARNARQRACGGGHPSTFIWLEHLDAFHIGALLALYEHRTVIEGWLLGVNPFDQWGVELGKTLAGSIEQGELANLPLGQFDRQAAMA